MSYCPFCGRELDERGNCPYCGYASSANNDEILGEAVETESKIIDDSAPDNNSKRYNYYSGRQDDAETFFRQARKTSLQKI